MLIKVAKRGRKHGLGMCGISQRPADVKKDFITQCDWLVWHRLTWDNDTSVVRRVLGSDYGDRVQELADGEAFLMTDWNDEIRRVQFRRKETFDAGATPGLDEFERPDLKSVNTDIVGELEEISERAKQRQDRVAQLERQLETKEEQMEELREDLERSQDVNLLAEQFTDALAQMGEATGSQNVQEALDELREQKNETIRDLRHRNDELLETNKELEERVAELEQKAESSTQLEQLQVRINEATEAYHRLGESLNIEPRSEEAERLQDRVEELQQELGGLRATTGKHSLSTSETEAEIETYRSFITDDSVENAISQAKETASSPRYVDGVISCIIEAGEPVSYREIADHLDITTTSHVASAVNALQAEDVVQKRTQAGRTKVDLAIDDLDAIRQRARRRSEAEDLLGEI
jgi:DNA repair exonuclease SbcCD ATPase subunit